jgi:hypothetical protein
MKRAIPGFDISFYLAAAKFRACRLTGAHVTAAQGRQLTENPIALAETANQEALWKPGIKPDAYYAPRTVVWKFS